MHFSNSDNIFWQNNSYFVYLFYTEHNEIYIIRNKKNVSNDYT